MFGGLEAGTRLQLAGDHGGVEGVTKVIEPLFHSDRT